VFEDLEFQLMEGIAHQEAEREELHKEMANLEMRLLQRRQQVKEVEQQQRQAAENAKSEAQDLSYKRQQLFQQIDEVSSLQLSHCSSNHRSNQTIGINPTPTLILFQEKAKLRQLQSNLEQLFQAGLCNGNLLNGTIECSSDTEEVNWNRRFRDAHSSINRTNSLLNGLQSHWLTVQTIFNTFLGSMPKSSRMAIVLSVRKILKRISKES